jgi:hypothetical protein
MRLVYCLIGMFLLGTASGCQTMWSSRLAKSLKPTDGRHQPATDPWITEAGTVARTEHPTDKVDDPLGLRKIFVSDKAREIERNCGVD